MAEPKLNMPRDMKCHGKDPLKDLTTISQADKMSCDSTNSALKHSAH
jgi:hypothetical protein